MKKFKIRVLSSGTALLSLLLISSFCNTDTGPDSQQKVEFTTEVVAEGFDSPWGMEWLPNGDMLVTDKPGKMWIVPKGSTQPTEIKGVPEVYNSGQGGLLGLVLHPDYGSNGWIYLSYSAKGDGGGNTVITRAKLKNNALVEQETIFQAAPLTRSGVHFGGRMDFDREGYLFFSVGERGEMENAQTLTNHCGKIHRIFDDGRVPEDNPFVEIPGAMPTIWSYGHRNPQGLMFHPDTWELYEHEHGPKGGDEVNIVRKGKNYGWPRITYGINYNGDIISDLTEKKGMEQPIHYWVPSIAPCGMTFLSSDRYPGWKGNLFVGSLAGQTLARLEIKDGKIVNEERLLNGMGRIRDVRQGPDGYLYVSFEGQGKIVRLMPK